MTTMYKENITCAVCGSQSLHTFLGSTNAFGSQDMDTRPPEMKRSTMDTWVQECPGCSYCAGDISALLDGAKENIIRPEYQFMRSDQSIGELARRFGSSSLLHEWSDELIQSGWDSLHAAWDCDDYRNRDKAILFRKRAYSLFSRARASGQSIADQAGIDELLLADICRRAGKMAEAEQLCMIGIDKTNEEFIKKLFAAEIYWLKAQDSSCHTVEEAGRIR